MAKNDTWMPLYIGDYLRDTGHLSTTEHGAYLLLLMQGWTRNGELPADEERLRTLARMSPQEWKRARTTLLAFFELDGDVYRQKRMTSEIEHASAMTEQRRAAGRASANARSRQRNVNGGGNGGANERSTSVATDAQREGQQTGRPSQGVANATPTTITDPPLGPPRERVGRRRPRNVPKNGFFAIRTLEEEEADERAATTH